MRRARGGGGARGRGEPWSTEGGGAGGGPRWGRAAGRGVARGGAGGARGRAARRGAGGAGGGGGGVAGGRRSRPGESRRPDRHYEATAKRLSRLEIRRRPSGAALDVGPGRSAPGVSAPGVDTPGYWLSPRWGSSLQPRRGDS